MTPSNANTSGLTPTDALRLVPVEPTEAVLTNMAIRFDHGLGCPGYYDNPIFGEPSHARRFEAAKTTMRQLYEEVVLSAAAPASPLPGGGWQDISTAPKDGTPLLAGSIHHSDREVVCWQDGLPSGSVAGAMNPDAPEEGWVNEGPHKDRFYANPRYFTHWQPLPAAPTGEPK